MDRFDTNPPTRGKLLPLRDEDLRGAAGGLSAITTIGFPVQYRPVQYRYTGPVPPVALPASTFDTNHHGWGGHH